MRLMPHSLFGRHLLMLATMILLGQMMAGALFFVFVQKPRAAETATMLAQNLVAVRDGLRALPRHERTAFVSRFNAANAGPAAGSPPTDRRLPFAQRLLLRAVSSQLADQGIDAVWRQQGGVLFTRLTVDGEAHWLAARGPMLTTRPVLSVVITWGASLGIALFGAWQIQRRINRPLKALSDVASDIEGGRNPTPVDEDGPTEIAAVARGFNRMQAALADRERTRSLMLAGISHDLRTPLSKMRLSVELLRDEPGTPPDPVLLGSMENACQRMDEIIGQFIDFARLEENARLSAVDMRDCLERAASACPGGEAVQLDAPAGLRVESHAPALARLLTNLIGNALKHGAPPVEVRARREHGDVLVTVDDAGAGIEPDVLEQLRRPFTRGNAARSGVAGAGLGLAIADQIALKLGARLDFGRAPGGGLRVELRLPALNS